MRFFTGVMLAATALQTAAHPPAYPRPGTTKLLENDKVIVWNVAWLKQQYPVHTHPYDLVGIAYTDGDRVIPRADGTREVVPTKAWSFQTQVAGFTHYEEGASDPPMKAVFIELKAAQPRGGEVTAGNGLAQIVGAPAFENKRAVAWRLGPESSGKTHGHGRDAVEVIFDGATPKSVEFVAQGTTHPVPAIAPAGRAYVFEIK